MAQISVVVPVFNSQECLAELNRQISLALRNTLDFELILVNDKSPDNSWNTICSLALEFPNIVGVNLRKNVGQDNAIMCGLAQAQGDYIVIMDDDLQHSPSDILRLHSECAARDLDACYAHFCHKKQAFWKNAGSWLNGKVSELVIGKPPHIYLSPYKIIRRDVIAEIVKYRGPFPYVDGLLFSTTSNVGQVDIEHHERFAGRSNYSLFKSIRVFLKLATGFSVVPLRISSYVGMGSALAGFLLALFYLGQYFLLHSIIEGWTTLALLVLILGGLTLFSIGILGEYLGRAYLDINGKPQYTIKEIRRG